MNLNDFFEDTNEGKCPHCNGPMFSELMINEKKDACYYKVKSRYKVWPSAYASGALVKCRKSHGKWGSKSESVEQGVAEVQTAHQYHVVSKLDAGCLTSRVSLKF